LTVALFALFGVLAGLVLAWISWPSTGIPSDDQAVVAPVAPTTPVLEPLGSPDRASEAEVAALEERVAELEAEVAQGHEAGPSTQFLRLPPGKVSGDYKHRAIGGGLELGPQLGTLDDMPDDVAAVVTEALAGLDLGELNCEDGNCVMLDKDGNPREDVQIMMGDISAFVGENSEFELPEGEVQAEYIIIEDRELGAED
jgi:hypothetical protein